MTTHTKGPELLSTTLTELDKKLKSVGITATITNFSISYDEHMIGSSAYMSIKCVAHNIVYEEVTADAFTQAMEALYD